MKRGEQGAITGVRVRASLPLALQRLLQRSIVGADSLSLAAEIGADSRPLLRERRRAGRSSRSAAVREASAAARARVAAPRVSSDALSLAQVLRLVLRQGFNLTLIGMLIGLAVALALAQLLSRLLYGLSPLNLPVFSAVVVLLAGVALLACYLPARRAARVDPLVALRHE